MVLTSNSLGCGVAIFPKKSMRGPDFLGTMLILWFDGCNIWLHPAEASWPGFWDGGVPIERFCGAVLPIFWFILSPVVWYDGMSSIIVYSKNVDVIVEFPSIFLATPSYSICEIPVSVDQTTVFFLTCLHSRFASGTVESVESAPGCLELAAAMPSATGGDPWHLWRLVGTRLVAGEIGNFCTAKSFACTERTHFFWQNPTKNAGIITMFQDWGLIHN